MWKNRLTTHNVRLKIHFMRSDLKVRFQLRGAVAVVRSGLLGYSGFRSCVSTTAKRRRDGGGYPPRVRRNGSWSHFSVPLCGAVAVGRQLASSLFSIEAAILILKIFQSLCNWTGESAVVLLIHQSNFIAIGESYQSPGFDISRNLRIRIRYLNRLLDRASTGRNADIKTKWVVCSDMNKIRVHYYEGHGFQYRNQVSWNIYHSYDSVRWTSMICLLMFIFLVLVQYFCILYIS